MKRGIHLIKTGISLVDKAWGGFYKQGTYFLIGPHQTGKTLFALSYAAEAASNGEVAVYFTTSRPKDLLIQAVSINIDLEQMVNKNKVIIIKVELPKDLPVNETRDNFLAEYMYDLVDLIEEHKPNRIVFDEMTPFVEFNDISYLAKVFEDVSEKIENLGVTSLLMLSDPATESANAVVNSLINSSTGVIYLAGKEEAETSRVEGIIKITPNIGHNEGRFSSGYYIDSIRGIVSSPAENEGFAGLTKFSQGLNDDNDTSLKSLPWDDFMELAGFYRGNGREASFIFIQLDEYAESHGLLSKNQLNRAIINSIKPREKVLFADDKIVVLVQDNYKNLLADFVDRIKSNLPNNNTNYIQNVLPYIKIKADLIDENVVDISKFLKGRLGKEQKTEIYK